MANKTICLLRENKIRCSVTDIYKNGVNFILSKNNTIDSTCYIYYFYIIKIAERDRDIFLLSRSSSLTERK